MKANYMTKLANLTLSLSNRIAEAAYRAEKERQRKVNERAERAINKPFKHPKMSKHELLMEAVLRVETKLWDLEYQMDTDRANREYVRSSLLDIEFALGQLGKQQAQAQAQTTNNSKSEQLKLQSELFAHLRDNQKNLAIKVMREMSGLGLREAKKFVDGYLSLEEE